MPGIFPLSFLTKREQCQLRDLGGELGWFFPLPITRVLAFEQSRSMDCAVGPVHRPPSTTHKSVLPYSAVRQEYGRQFSSCWPQGVRYGMVTSRRTNRARLLALLLAADNCKSATVSERLISQTLAQPPTACTVCTARKGKAGNQVDPRQWSSGDIAHLRPHYSCAHGVASLWWCGLCSHMMATCSNLIPSLFSSLTQQILVLLPPFVSYLPLKGIMLFYTSAKKENEAACTLVVIVWLSPEDRRKGADASRSRTLWKLSDLHYPTGFLLL